jgi:AcrR family transcriptional regulator
MPKIVDHDQVRADIVARAVELFAEQGFGGLGIRGLAKAVGMAKSSIYYYFPTKEALIEAVIEAVVAQDVASLEGAIGSAGTFDDRLDRAITWATDNEDRMATQIRILNEAAREQIWTDDGSVIGTYVKGLSRVVGLNVAAARAFYLHILGVVLQRMVDSNRTSLRRELSAFTDLLKASRKDVEGKVSKMPAPTAKPAPAAAPAKVSKTATKATGKAKATKAAKPAKVSKAAKTSKPAKVTKQPAAAAKAKPGRPAKAKPGRRK